MAKVAWAWHDFAPYPFGSTTEFQLAGLGVRNLHDVLLLQNAKRLRPFENNFERESFLGAGGLRERRDGLVLVSFKSLQEIRFFVHHERTTLSNIAPDIPTKKVSGV